MAKVGDPVFDVDGHRGTVIRVVDLSPKVGLRINQQQEIYVKWDLPDDPKGVTHETGRTEHR